MPTHYDVLLVFLIAPFSCADATRSIEAETTKNTMANAEKKIREIYLPAGFAYVNESDSAYSNWLLDLKFKTNRPVYLYDGKLKSNQNVHYGILNIDIGKKDIIQCADAAVKIRADYLFEKNRIAEINFIATSGDKISFESWLKGTRWKAQGNKLVPYTTTRNVNSIKKDYDAFMNLVYTYCGTYSLSNQLKQVNDISSLQAGDIFIKGGFPGHAVTVMAVAQNGGGKKIFLLSQGYMPAQDIHILKNYANADLNPWYTLSDIYPLYTPEWQFNNGSLKRW
ncbi:MAG TPA: DUF4846 domain-containing protein [Chitinophagaceae bacterium]|nr:DUF4846 domain-containing protein [Chitinophagaceae bacterium]